jgi:uncharacterized lipoprotein YajG
MLAILALSALLAGCATDRLDVKVPLGVTKPSTAAAHRAVVQVTDIRKEATLERTTVGGVSLGRIHLQPSEQELVRAVIEASAYEALARRGGAGSLTILAGIRVFDVATPATPLYWDVTTTIELVLRVQGQDRTIAGNATERTFVWPSEEMIARVTAEALRRLGADAGRALDELLATPR